MKSILIVEDIFETQKWLASIVTTAFPDCQIDMASTMKGGIEKGLSNNYQLALIDLGLPDGSGLEVLRSIKQKFQDTICVVTTVMGDDAHIVAALSAGAQGYLLKEQPEDMLKKQLIQLNTSTLCC